MHQYFQDFNNHIMKVNFDLPVYSPCLGLAKYPDSILMARKETQKPREYVPCQKADLRLLITSKAKAGASFKQLERPWKPSLLPSTTKSARLLQTAESLLRQWAGDTGEMKANLSAQQFPRVYL